MKILFAANRFPYPPYRGDKLKIYHLTKRLAQQHELHLLTFLQDKSDLKYLPELEKIFKSIHLVELPKWASYLNTLKGIFNRKPFQVNYFSSEKMEDKIDELLREYKFDAVHVQHLRLAQFWKDKKEIPRILDLPDAYSLYWKRRIDAHNGVYKWFNKAEYGRVLHYENILNSFDKTLVCSVEDKDYLLQVQGIKNVGLLPNGVDVATFNDTVHDYSIANTILFTGNMDYAPNVDAVCYFAKEIFPVILQSLPRTKFVIAGQRPVKKVQELACENIEVTGFVKNLNDMYKKAAILVAPLRFGAGTQNKVLEAMAMGVPVVSRNIGFKGLNIQSGQGVILAIETQEFAGACIQLLQSSSMRKETGEQGQEVISRQFDWKVISRKLDEYFKSVSR